MIEAKITGMFTDPDGNAWDRITCREGTTWCVESSYITHLVETRPIMEHIVIHSPYLGLPVKLLESNEPYSSVEPPKTKKKLKVKHKAPNFLDNNTGLAR